MSTDCCIGRVKSRMGVAQEPRATVSKQVMCPPVFRWEEKTLNRRFQQHTVVVLQICVMFVMLCGGAHASVTGSYSAQQPTWIAYLRLTQTGSKLVGYIQYVYADSRLVTTSRRSDLHGSADSSTIALKLDGFLGYGGKDAAGEVRGRTLVLEFALDNGRVDRVTFSPTTGAKWNKTVSAFEARWARAIQSQRNQQTAAAEKLAVKQEARKCVLAFYQGVKDLTRSLDALDTARQKVAEAERVVAAHKQAVVDAEAIAKKAEQEAVTSQEQYEAGSLRYKVGTRKYEVGSAEYAVHSRRYDVERILDEIDKNKGTIVSALKRLRLLVVNAGGKDQAVSAVSNLAHCVAVVTGASAKIRTTADPRSPIVREIRRGGHIGAGSTIVGDYIAVVLPDDSHGFALRSEVQVLNLDDLGRKMVGQSAIVTTLYAVVHKERDENSEAILEANRDNILCVTRIQGDWCAVELQSGTHGWVPRADLRFDGHQLYRDEEGKLAIAKPTR